MIYRIHHLTSYAYSQPVLVSQQMAHLAPRSFAEQTCRRSGLRITPSPSTLEGRGQDYFGNNVNFFTLDDPHRTLTVEALSRVEVRPRHVPQADLTPPWESVAATMMAGRGGDIEAMEFCFDSPYAASSEALAAYARPSFAPGRPVMSGLADLMHRIHKDFIYDPTATTVATPLARVLADRRGVCQDFAHLGIAALRAIGLPARYVSGYVLTRPPPGKERLRGGDASHAWFSSFVPGAGWVDFDPTNDVLPDLEHVVIGWGRDFDDVSPLRGVVLGGGEHSLKVSVTVEPIET